MKILLVVKQKKNVETFTATIRALIDRGHVVALAVQEHSEAQDDRYRDAIDSPRFNIVRCPPHRADRWADVAWLLRSLRDCVHYQQPAMRAAVRLQARSIQKLREELRLPGDNDAMAAALRELPGPQIQRLDAVFDLAERQLPSDRLYDAFLRAEAPDVLLVSPLVHFGSAQADVVASARALGIPVGMLLYSWDNLSTKGCLHQPPDWMFVWNERQRSEAQLLHNFPESRVVIAGAPRFDPFFELCPKIPRDEFHASLGLDPAAPTLLYVCSSQLIAANERTFVTTWLAALRAAGGTLARCNVLVRPHPDIGLVDDDEPTEDVRWPSLRGAKAYLSRPFADARTIVVKTSDRAQQGLYECIHHSAAVIGLNTSAELEAAIVGRPVYTVLAGEQDAEGQSSTLHFHYLTEAQGGFVRVGHGIAEHVAQLEAELRTPQDSSIIRQFVGEFLRPHGIARPVAPVLADAIERTFVGLAAPADTSAEATDRDSAPSVLVRTDESRVIRAVTKDKYGYALQVRTVGDAGASAHYRLDKGIVEWLRRAISIGDVIYDVDAGDGVYALLAAKYHGAVVVAFEPGFAAFGALCENIRLNGCDGSVMPVSVALSSFDGVGELKYPAGMAGWRGHSVKPGAWRVRRSAGEEGSYKQPVYAMPLDVAIGRYGLPAPHHLRLGNARSAPDVLEGAAPVLGSPGLRTIVFSLPEDEGGTLVERLAPGGWSAVLRIPVQRGYVVQVLSRAPLQKPKVAPR